MIRQVQGCSHGGRRWAGPPGTLGQNWLRRLARKFLTLSEKKLKILQGLLHFRNILIHKMSLFCVSGIFRK